MANCPPSTGARATTAVTLPFHRDIYPAGANRAPFTVCHRVPPTQPIQYAPPTSSTIRQGHGSRSANPDCRGIYIYYAILNLSRELYWVRSFGLATMYGVLAIAAAVEMNSCCRHERRKRMDD
jgi:hypothetical protein